MILNENRIRRIILDEIAQAMTSNPTDFDVRASFNRINKAFFNNALPNCSFNLKLKKGYLGYFKYYGKRGNKLINPIISVNGMYQYDSKQLDSIVAHEMIHYYLALNGVDMNCTHGSDFQQLASQMNSSLGLNISEKIDTGNMTYGMGQQNTLQPSTQLLGYMNSYMNSLSGYAQQMKANVNNTNGNVVTFINNLYTFTIAMVNALSRCIKKKTLNEANGLELPQFVNDFMNGYRDWSHKTLNFFDDINRYRNGYGSYGNYYKSGKLIINNNMKLAELLYNIFPNIEQEYNNINNKTFNSLNSMPYITNTINVVNDLKTKIDAEINNAQGNNP